MSIHFFLEAVLLLITSVVVLRFAGKKTVAKMTILETVIVLAIGTTMGHAVKENKFWQVILILVFYGVFLIVIQKMELKFSVLERYIVGDATLVIKDGKIIMDNLKKLRMTRKQLEMRLRQKGISYISDVKTGTIESDGEFGYELMPAVNPVTQEQLMELLYNEQQEKQPKDGNLFDIVVKKNQKTNFVKK